MKDAVNDQSTIFLTHYMSKFVFRLSYHGPLPERLLGDYSHFRSPQSCNYSEQCDVFYVSQSVFRGDPNHGCVPVDYKRVGVM